MQVFRHSERAWFSETLFFLVTNPPQKINWNKQRKKILKCEKNEKQSTWRQHCVPALSTSFVLTCESHWHFKREHKDKATIWVIVSWHGITYSYESFCVVEPLARLLVCVIDKCPKKSFCAFAFLCIHRFFCDITGRDVGWTCDTELPKTLLWLWWCTGTSYAERDTRFSLPLT